MDTGTSKKNPHTRASGYGPSWYLSAAAGICIQFGNSLDFLIRGPANKEDDYVLRPMRQVRGVSDVPKGLNRIERGRPVLISCDARRSICAR